MSLLITVTQSDIDAGQRGKCDSCPVSLAIKRHCLPSVDVDVNTWVCFRLGKKLVCVNMPAEEWRCIRYFDRGRGMVPHSFEVEIPVWANSSSVNRPEREGSEHA